MAPTDATSCQFGLVINGSELEFASNAIQYDPPLVTASSGLYWICGFQVPKLFMPFAAISCHDGLVLFGCEFRFGLSAIHVAPP